MKQKRSAQSIDSGAASSKETESKRPKSASAPANLPPTAATTGSQPIRRTAPLLPGDKIAQLGDGPDMPDNFIWNRLHKTQMSQLSSIICPLIARSSVACDPDKADKTTTDVRKKVTRFAILDTNFEQHGQYYDALSNRFPTQCAEFHIKIKRNVQAFSKTCRAMTRCALNNLFNLDPMPEKGTGLEYVRAALNITNVPVFTDMHPLVIAARRNRTYGTLEVFPDNTKSKNVPVFDKGWTNSPEHVNFYELLCNLNRIQPLAEQNPVGNLYNMPFWTLPTDARLPLFNEFTGESVLKIHYCPYNLN
jgi:hypothetical protein